MFDGKRSGAVDVGDEPTTKDGVRDGAQGVRALGVRLPGSSMQQQQQPEGKQERRSFVPPPPPRYAMKGIAPERSRSMSSAP